MQIKQLYTALRYMLDMIFRRNKKTPERFAAIWTAYMVHFSVFDKVCARFHKTKPDIKINVFIVQRFGIMRRAGTVIVFSAGGYF